VALAHASFPCTDTSLAGARGGIRSGESSAFWEFERILKEMDDSLNTDKPPIVLVENVAGLLTSGKGQDLVAILEALNNLGYVADLLIVDAVHFVPQSRVRLFVIGSLIDHAQERHEIESIIAEGSDTRPKKIQDFIRLNSQIKWHIQDVPNLPYRDIQLVDVIDEHAVWWPRDRTDYLYSQMFDRHKDIVERMMENNYWSYGTVFRRMRIRDGSKQSTAELRTDGIAGCLRTPKGGSARQIILRAGYGKYDARLLNARECARLMGADDYNLPEGISLNSALFGFGDAVCVPVIEWISTYCLDPILERQTTLTETRIAS